MRGPADRLWCTWHWRLRRGRLLVSTAALTEEAKWLTGRNALWRQVNFGDDDGTAKPPRSDAGPDSPSSSYDDLELSDSERDVLVPVVDQLIRGISSDFLFDCDGPCYLDSLIGCSGQGGMAGSAGGAGQHAQSRMAEPPAKAALPREQTDAGKDHLIKAAPAGQPAAPTVGRINLAAMISEKSALKRELRSLDVEFEQREGRKPTKQEKEHLRPLYVRYWKLKHQISKLHAMGAGK